MSTVSRLFVVVASLLLASLPTRAQPDLILGVSEGTSGGLDHARVIAKYGGMASVLGKALNRRVAVVFVREFAMLDEGIKRGTLDLVFARPSDYPARAMRDNGYQFVASASPDGQCLVIVAKDSPIKALADTRDTRWVAPEPVSYMARFCAAELRDRGVQIASDRLRRVREQGAVPFYLDNKFADVGVVASYSSVAKSLEKSGHRVIHTSVSQPYFPLVASRQFSVEQVQAMQRALAALPDSDTGRDLLQMIGVKGFDTTSGDRLRALPRWLGV
jgi:phosphonate transport system substrate-binding protein